MDTENKALLKLVVLSFLITTAFSCVFGYALAPIFGSFKHAFIFSFLLQVIGNYIYNDHRVKKQNKDEEVLLNERLDILSRNFVKFDCPCGDFSFYEVVYPGQDNTFKCEKCNQNIRVDVTMTPIVITEPLVSDPLEKIKDLSGN